MKQFARVGIFLLMLNFLAGNIGSFSQELNNFIALCLLLAFLLMYFPVKMSRTQHLQNLLAFAIFVASMAIFAQGGINKFFGILFFLFAFCLLLRNTDRQESELYPLMLTTAFYSLFLICYQYIPQTFLELQSVTAFFSSFIGMLTRQEITLGATYFGLHITVIFYLFHISVFLLSGRKKIVFLSLILIFLLLANIIYVIIRHYLMLKLKNAQLFISAFDLQILLFLLCLSFVYLHLKKVSLRNISWRMKLKDVIYISSSSLVLIISVIVLTTSFSFSAVHTAKIVLYDKGYLDWKTPVFGQYGGKKGGMFGLLPKYLTAKGYEVSMDSITPESLRETHVLVIINPGDLFSDEEKNLIWNFVSKGGSLLAMGDHTGLEAIREPLNALLMPFKISLNFDSAISLEEQWEHAFEFRPHFINQHVVNNQETQIGIGASLTISSPARSVIIGKHGFSDKGNPDDAKRGYLGDMKYSCDERLGDLILVSEANHGRGKVMVFGDTSSFQNGALVQSSQFVDKVFSWLTTPHRNLYPYKIYLFVILLLSVLALLIIGRVNSIFLFICPVAIYLSLSFTTFFISTANTEKADDINTKIAYIDISHLERCHLDSWSPDAFGGLTYNLMRNDYMPFVLRHFSKRQIQNSQLLVIIAPAKPFSGQEIEVLESFVRHGGYIIFTLGREERTGSQSLLRKFQMDIGNTPLGRIEPSQNSGGLFFYKAWPVICEQNEVEVLCKAWDYPVIVFKPYHQGGVLLVGDSAFLLNKNLEGLYNYHLPNIEFLKQVIDEKFEGENIGK